MKLALALLASAGLTSHVAVALACGASAPPYYVVASQLPTGEGAPLNTPLVVELTESADGPVYDAINPTLTLSVKGNDEALEVKAVGAASRLSWVPVEPLEPSTEYEAHVNLGYEGHADTIWTFTTGDVTAPSLALEGELEATLEAGREPILQCDRCGGPCTDTGEEREVTWANLTLPRVKDGFSGRRGEVWLTDDTPYSFTSDEKPAASETDTHLVSLSTFVLFDDDGKPTQNVRLTLPEEAEPYHPCFVLRVFDDRGDTAISEPLCLEASFPTVDPEPVVTDRESNTSSGCSFGVNSPTGASSLLAALGFVALLRRRRAS